MYQNNVNFRFGGPLTPGVKKIMLINAAVFILQFFSEWISPEGVEHFFGLSHQGFIREFKLWQVFTYMFLHGGFLHIFFNLLTLWMFGGELEQRWGTAGFIKYYLYTGTGAGFFIALMNFIAYGQNNLYTVTIGASGAVYAILLAYGINWPNRKVLLYFVVPVKIKYLVLAFGLMEFFGTLSGAAGRGGNISHIGHLGGLISGIVYLYLNSLIMRTGRGPQKIAGKKNFLEEKLREIKNKKKEKEINGRIQAKKIIDELLEKIARNGMKSLSPEERKKLEWARKNYYPERNETLH